jgi:hypothetical protein
MVYNLLDLIGIAESILSKTQYIAPIFILKTFVKEIYPEETHNKEDGKYRPPE